MEVHAVIEHFALSHELAVFFGEFFRRSASSLSCCFLMKSALHAAPQAFWPRSSNLFRTLLHFEHSIRSAMPREIGQIGGRGMMCELAKASSG